MLKIFNYILFILGLKYITKNNKFNDNINIKNSNNNRLKCNKIKYVFYIFYRIIIFIIISFEPLYYFYLIITTNNRHYYSTFLFMLIPSLNYLVGINYFKNKYFDQTIEDFYLNTEKKIKCFFTDYFISSMLLVISFFTVITLFILNITNIESHDIMYNYINSTTEYYIVSVYSLINDLYGITILFTNLFVFFFIFYKHLEDIRNQKNKILKEYSWSKDYKHMEISNICYEIIWLRNELENSISKLQSFYVINTIFGSIAIGFIIEYQSVTWFQILSIIIWSLSQIIYFIIIYLIVENKKNLIQLIKKPKFCIQYIKRKHEYNNNKFNNFLENISNKRKKDYILNNYPNIVDSRNDIEMNIISKNNNQEDTNIEMNINKILHNYRDDDNNNESPEINIDNYIIQNSSSIDWIILNTILNESWGYFEFLGYEFNSSNSLKTCIGITVLIIFGTKWMIDLNLI